MLTEETADEITVAVFHPLYQAEIVDLILHVQNVENSVKIAIDEQPISSILRVPISLPAGDSGWR